MIQLGCVVDAALDSSFTVNFNPFSSNFSCIDDRAEKKRAFVELPFTKTSNNRSNIEHCFKPLLMTQCSFVQLVTPTRGNNSQKKVKQRGNF